MFYEIMYELYFQDSSSKAVIISGINNINQTWNPISGHPVLGPSPSADQHVLGYRAIAVQPVLGSSPSAVKSVLRHRPSAVQPVLGPTPSAVQPVLGPTPSAVPPVLGPTPSAVQHKFGQKRKGKDLERAESTITSGMMGKTPSKRICKPKKP